jgi:hypothetical protein
MDGRATVTIATSSWIINVAMHMASNVSLRRVSAGTASPCHAGVARRVTTE